LYKVFFLWIWFLFLKGDNPGMKRWERPEVAASGLFFGLPEQSRKPTEMGEYTVSPGGLQGRDDGRDAFNRGSVQGMWKDILCLPTMLAGAGLLWRRVPGNLPDKLSQESGEEISADGKGPGNPPAG
jgi:hypothetical protein